MTNQEDAHAFTIAQTPALRLIRGTTVLVLGCGASALPMTLRSDQHQVLRLAIVLLGLGAIAGLFELSARQAPYTPLELGLLPGPIQQLRDAALVHGFMAFLAGLSLPAAWPTPLAPKRFLGLLVVGHALLFAALLWAAFSGRMAVQIWDPRPLLVALTALRIVGHLTVVGAYWMWAHRLWRALR